MYRNNCVIKNKYYHFTKVVVREANKHEVCEPLLVAIFFYYLFFIWPGGEKVVSLPHTPTKPQPDDLLLNTQDLFEICGITCIKPNVTKDAMSFIQE